MYVCVSSCVLKHQVVWLIKMVQKNLQKTSLRSADLCKEVLASLGICRLLLGCQNLLRSLQRCAAEEVCKCPQRSAKLVSLRSLRTYIHTYLHTIHTYTYINTCIHIQTYGHTYIDTIHTYICTYIHINIHAHTWKCTLIHNSMYIHIYTHINTYRHENIQYINAHTYIYTYIQTYINMQTYPVCLWRSSVKSQISEEMNKPSWNST